MPTPKRAHSDNIEGVWEGKESQEGETNLFTMWKRIPRKSQEQKEEYGKTQGERPPAAIVCRMFVTVGGKGIQRSDSCHCHLCWKEVYCRSRTPPFTPSPSALTGPGMCELCRLARMSYLHLLTRQPEQTHNLAKFTARINSHVANNLCPVISINKYGLQSRVSSPGAYGKERLLKEQSLYD